MPYDRNKLIAAFHDYYNFLKSMYMPDDTIQNPPDRGWPEITKERFACLGKNDEVIELLRYLPYPDPGQGDLVNGPMVGNAMHFRHFNDKRTTLQLLEPGVQLEHFEGEEPLREPGIVGLSVGDRNSTWIILNVEIGVMASTISGKEQSGDDIGPFLEGLKQKFKTLEWLPVSEVKVTTWSAQYSEGRKRMFTEMKECYLAHGWPDLDKFDKHKCRAARKNILMNIPELADCVDTYFREGKSQ